MISREITHRIRGRIKNLSPDHSANLVVRFDRFDPSSLDCDLTVNSKSHLFGELNSLFGRDCFTTLEIENLDDPGFPIGIVAITSFSQQLLHDHLTLSPSEVRLGFDPPTSDQDSSFFVAVELTPSRILGSPSAREYSSTGAITVSPPQSGDVMFETKFGTWRIIESFDFLDSSMAKKDITNVVQGTTVRGEITVPKGATMSDVHDSVAENIYSLCLLIGFCYRRPVRAYDYQYRPKVRTESTRHIARVRIRTEPYENRDRDLGLIEYPGLSSGGLDQLLRSYREHPKRDIIRRVMTYLSASAASPLLEESFFLSVSSLDLLVGALDKSQNHQIDRALWEELLPMLQESLHTFCQDRKLDELEKIVAKRLPKLRHDPLASRICRHASATEIETNDLWPSLGFKAGIERTISARNDLFHAAKVSNPGAMYGDRHRIATLVERLLLHELTFPSDRLNYHKDRELNHINTRP